MYERSDAYFSAHASFETIPRSDNLQLAGNCRVTFKIYTDGLNKHFPWPTDALTSIHLEYTLKQSNNKGCESYLVEFYNNLPQVITLSVYSCIW